MNNSDEAHIVKQLREVTNSNSPRQVEMMGIIADDPRVTPERFEAWFSHFADGMNFVYQNYGVINDNFNIVDTVTVKGEKRERILGYIPELDTIAVTRGFIRDDVETLDNPNIRSSTGHTGSLLFTPREAVTLLGVEEAYHAHQWKTNSSKYKQDGQEYLPVGMNGLTEQGVYSNDVEKDAAKVVRHAIQHFGFEPLPSNQAIVLGKRTLGID